MEGVARNRFPPPGRSRRTYATAFKQEAVLRRAAEAAHKSLTEFILDAAYQGAEPLQQLLFQAVPHAASAAVLLQMVAIRQVAEVLFEGIAAGSGQFDGIHHRDAPVLTGELHDLQ